MSCPENLSNSSNQPNAFNLDITHYGLIGLSTLTVLTTLLFGVLWYKTHQSLKNTIQDYRKKKSTTVPPQDSPHPSPTCPQSVLVVPPLDRNSSQTRLHEQKSRQSVRFLWKPLQQNPHVTRTDLNLIQLIKAGREGAFYKARMLRGTCKGHLLVTCKIAKEGVTAKQVETEASIMRKLVYHKNVLQLLDWNTAEEPFVLIMEFVNYGTLRSFVQTHQDKLSADPEIQNLFAIASYHIALAMEHLRSKMPYADMSSMAQRCVTLYNVVSVSAVLQGHDSVVHCDLALRNILVSRFPWEIKVAEFGLARDLTRMRSRRSTRKKNHRERVPLRWYPPEYFRNSYYSFKGDVWAFGIVLWELQTFGRLPYPNLETSDQVVCHICAGHRNVGPDTCRPEILQIMKDCWLEPYTARPSFTELVRILESIIDNDSDYVDVLDERPSHTAED